MLDTSLKYFTQIFSVITQFNISKEDSLKAAGLNELPTSDRVDANILAQILNFAALSLSDPQIGIKCGLKYPVLQYTRPAEFLKLCANIRHAADMYNCYCPLFHTVGAPTGVITEDGIDRMIWVPNFASERTEDYRQFVELIMTNYLTSINWLSWKTPQAVKHMNFKHEALLPIKHYEDLFDCTVQFGREEYSLILQDGATDAPFSTADQAELTKVCVKFDMALNELFEEESLVDRIELQIRRSIEHAGHDKASIAKALGLSERSMARALKDKDTSFKAIKNRVLQNIAVAKINEGHPLVEIAYSLGYNDQSAFTRAYKKWFGYPPRKHKNSKS